MFDTFQSKLNVAGTEQSTLHARQEHTSLVVNAETTNCFQSTLASTTVIQGPTQIEQGSDERLDICGNMESIATENVDETLDEIFEVKFAHSKIGHSYVHITCLKTNGDTLCLRSVLFLLIE